MVNSYLMKISSMALLALITGCANYVKTVSVSNDVKRIDQEKQRYMITIDEDELAKGYFKAKVLKETRTDQTTLNRLEEKKYYTPYSAWRELYEIPTGAVLLPCGFTLQILDIVLLGMIPNRTIETTWDCSWAGMNPLLNIESSKRVVVKDGNVQEKEVDKEQRVHTEPAQNDTLQIVCGDDVWEYKLNKNGEIEVSVLDKNNVAKVVRARELYFRMKNAPNDKVTMVISRELQRRLSKAEKEIQVYRQNPTGSGLAKCVLALEKLSLPRLAWAIEKEEMKKHQADSNFGKKFEEAINQ